MKKILSLLFTPAVTNVLPEDAYERQRGSPELFVILDVRQPLEYGTGTIPGAVQIPMTQLARRIEELPRDRTILTICRSSHRSPVVARWLREAGFDVLNISGGILAWEKAGLPVEK